MDPTLETALKDAFGDRLALIEQLRGGAMARVVRARDTKLGREIVIKVLTPDVAASVSAERFRREIGIAARLQHPQIVPVLDAGEINGMPWYTMPFVAGESLQHAMASGNRLPRAQALDILRDVARALAAAHAEGVVHRDIKPGNVLLSSGSAVVTDFGIARAIATARTNEHHGTQLTDAGIAMGTPAYMAPEQVVNDAVDARADVYSWGVMAYELLAGAHPFAHHTDARRVIAAHLGETVAPLSPRAPGLSPRIASLVMQCLSKDPAHRPQDGGALLRALDAAVVGSSLGDAPVVVTRRTHWGRIAGVSVLAAGLLWLGITAAKRAPAASNAASAAAADTVAPILAVMPFEAVGEAADSLFADALSDAVSSRLSRLVGLRVIDRASVLTLHDVRADARTIGRELGAQYLLRATVRWAKSGGETKVQVMPTVVRTKDGTTLWAGDALTTATGDPFAVQATLASQVADALDVAMESVERDRLKATPTSDPAAFAAFERGHRYESAYRLSGDEAVGKAALAAYEDAVRADPRFADALGSRASMLRDLVRRRVLPVTWSDTVTAVAKAALALDSTQWRAAEILAQAAVGAGRVGDGFAIIERAVAARPSSGALQLARAEIAAVSGDTGLARDAVMRAVALAPRDADVLDRAAFQSFNTLRDLALSDSLARRAAARDSTLLTPLRLLVSIAVARGDTDAAGVAFTRYRTRGGPITPPLLSELRRGNAAMRAIFDTISPIALDLNSPFDTVMYFSERYRAAAMTGATAKAHEYAQLGATVASRMTPRAGATTTVSPRTSMTRAWWAAVSGDTSGARRMLTAAKAAVPDSQRGGPAPGDRSCRTAEVQAMLHDSDAMLVSLRTCLQSPGGYWSAYVLGEPAFAPYRRDPKLRALLNSFTAPVAATPRN